jgi:hypothetical protein
MPAALKGIVQHRLLFSIATATACVFRRRWFAPLDHGAPQTADKCPGPCSLFGIGDIFGS